MAALGTADDLDFDRRLNLHVINTCYHTIHNRKVEFKPYSQLFCKLLQHIDTTYDSNGNPESCR